MQKLVEQFLEENRMQCGETARYLDLVSEVGELGKELLKGSDYGAHPYQHRDRTREELGDCLFALLALSSALHIDAREALEQVLEKYKHRLDTTGTAGSGR